MYASQDKAANKFSMVTAVLPKFVPLFIALWCTCHVMLAQQSLLEQIFDETHDSTFVVSYDRFITGRIYLSKKYTRLDIVDRSFGTRLEYRPNTTLNLGVGATYGNFTLNLAYGFRFLNPEGGQGDTRWLDLQARMYGRRFIVDFYGQFYKGLYLRNTSDIIAEPGNIDGSYIIRSDIYLQQVGVAASHIFNHKRFSYRASFVQNEWQRKSAGSLLAGFEVYSGFARGDSSMIPENTSPPGLFEDLNVSETHFFELGPSMGYAHTLVYKENWFVTGHLGLNMVLGWISEYTEDGLNRRFGGDPNIMSRLVVGYNSPQWFFGLSYINNSLRFGSSFHGVGYVMDTGNVRFNVARRFVPGPETKRYLRIVKDFEKLKE